MKKIISYLSNTLNPSNVIDLTLDDALHKIKSGEFKSKVEAVQQYLDDEAKYREAKKTLPSFMFNGSFSHASNSGFKKSSGLFHFDIDKLEDAVSIKDAISKLPGIVFCFISPSKKGIKGAVRILDDEVNNDEDFKRVYFFFERWFKERGYTLDSQCKDVRRVCFVSYDPDLYFNDEAEPVFIPHKKSLTKDDCIKRIENIFKKANNGSRHGARLSASRLAGGYVAGGLIDYQMAYDLLCQLSDTIADNGNTTKGELKTIEDGLKIGMDAPIYSDSKNYEPHYEAQEWVSDLSSKIDYIIPFPCLARKIQLWMLENSKFPQPALCFAATMVILAHCIGRNMAYGNIKGNVMFLCMAESGEGKDFPFKMVKLILSEVGKRSGIYAKIASGAALTEALIESPSMLFHIDEFGNYMNSINGKNANTYAREIVDIMTECYTSADSEFVGKKTKGVEAAIIKEPNLCVYGLSTERQVFDGLRTSDLANGSLARYSMLFGLNGLLPKKISNQKITVPTDIINELKDLIKQFNNLGNMVDFSSKQLNITEEYENEKFRIETDIKKLSNALRDQNSDKSAFTPMYNRVAVRCIQQAMLIDQCKNIDVLKWLEKLELESVNVFMKKFLHLGADNEDQRLANRLTAKIKESGTRGISAADLTRSTQFIKSYVRTSMLSELLNTGLISKKEMNDNKQRSTTFYFWNK